MCGKAEPLRCRSEFRKRRRTKMLGQMCRFSFLLRLLQPLADIRPKEALSNNVCNTLEATDRVSSTKDNLLEHIKSTGLTLCYTKGVENVINARSNAQAMARHALHVLKLVYR